MAIHIERRQFIFALGGAAAAWPLAAGAQQPAMPVIGFLNSRSPGESAHVVAAFHQGLKEAGHVDGQNVAIAYRWADGQYDRLPALAADLVGLNVEVICAAGGGVSAIAAKAATSAIPIVFVVGDLDPVNSGLVASLNRPGGNITGISPFTAVLAAKRLQLLYEMVPNASVVAVLTNPNNPSTVSELRDIQDAADTLKLRLRILDATTERDFDIAFAILVQEHISALLVGADNFFTSKRDLLIKLAARHAVPAIWYYRYFVVGGGLVSYGPSLEDAYRQAGIYTGRILKGEKPADMPVLQPTKFELVINLRTAKSLDLHVPDKLLALADEVIN
jgi:putative tryptophan/tyrosine transport system substrate-binding protein